MTISPLKSPNKTIRGDRAKGNFVADKSWSLIPPGIYRAQCIRYEKGRSHHNSVKLFLHFKIVDDGSYRGKELFMAMNLVDSRTGKEFTKIPPGSKYYQNWAIANNNKLPSRGDRMTPRIFKNHIFEVQVRTVKRKFPHGMEIPECFHYSVVDYLIGKVA